MTGRSLPHPGAGAWLRWQLARLWSRVTLPELLAASAGAFWLGLAFHVNAPLRAELDRQARQLREHAVQPPRGALPAQGGAGTAIESFFPGPEHREEQLVRLHALLDKHGLSHARITYQTEPVRHLPLQRVTLHLDINGGYRMQREFMREMLATLPNLALEEITLEKADGQGEGMTSLMGVSLYYHQPSLPEVMER